MPEDTPNFPTSAADLLDWLNEHYPAACIRPSETLEAAHRRAGARELVEGLLAWRAYEIGGDED